jgi:hypothetical protein
LRFIVVIGLDPRIAVGTQLASLEMISIHEGARRMLGSGANLTIRFGRVIVLASRGRTLRFANILVRWHWGVAQ